MKPDSHTAPSHEELLTRWIDGDLSPADQSVLDAELARHPEWRQEKESAERLRTLLRQELPAHREPASAEFFTTQIMQQIAAEHPAAAPPPRRTGRFFQWLRSAWAIPLATSAAVLVAGFFMLRQPVQHESFSTPYTPDPNVKATLSFDETVNATIIDLEGLESIPDTQEIRAFAVNSSGPVTPGEPQRFFAANDPSKLLFVLYPGADIQIVR